MNEVTTTQENKLQTLFKLEAENERLHDALDKIRSEVEKEYLAEGHTADYWNGIDKCLEIIDKYKLESECKE